MTEPIKGYTKSPKSSGSVADVHISIRGNRQMRNGMVDIKGITESIFKLDKRIRYVAILNPRYDLLESKMRGGVSSLTPAQTDRDFIRMAAPLMVDSAEKLRPFCGTMRHLTVRYDKVFLALYRTAAHLLILSLEPQVDQALLDEIGNSVRKLELAVAEDEDKGLSS